MSALTDREFLDFLESYKFLDNDTENPRYYNVITELSRSNPTSGNGRPLIENDDIKMYNLDNMKHDSKFFKGSFPKSTDAIYCKTDGEGNIQTIYFIEFKGHDFTEPNAKNKVAGLRKEMDNRRNELVKGTDNKKCFKSCMFNILDDVIDEYADTLEFSLQLKPMETITMTLPILYQEYCYNNPNVEFKNIYEFLSTHDKKFYVFVRKFCPDESDEVEVEEEPKSMNLTAKFYSQENKKEKKIEKKNEACENRSNTHLRALGLDLNEYYLRLEKTNIFSTAKIFEKNKFKTFLEEQHLIKPTFNHTKEDLMLW